MVVQLTSLVETSHPALLIYSLPLLLLSIVIAFAGTFLTLDRTRTFAPRSDADPLPTVPGSFDVKKSATSLLRKFRLDGGLGGLAVGYVFGLHAATFLSLLIMNESSASPLTSTTFLVVWIFSVIPTTILGGRWKVAALIFIGITGGIALSLALCIITHPSLTSRVVLTSIFTPLVTLAVIIPSVLPSPSLSGLAHSTSRMATSCAGAFSVTMAITLLTRSQNSYSWANAWDRLWVSDGDGWGTSKEKGFDALFCVLWICGALADLGLKRWIGEDPNEKWDTYLADYVSSLPNADDRAGKFRPLPSWWDRILKALHVSSHKPAHPHEMLFPSDAELALKPQYISVPDAGEDEKPAIYLSKQDLQKAVSPEAYNWEPSSPTKGAGFLRKERTRLGKGFTLKEDSMDDTQNILDLARRPTYLKKAKSARVEQRKQRLADKACRRKLEFRPADGFSSDSDDSVSSDMDELQTPLGTPTRERDVYVRASATPITRMHSLATSLSGTTVHPSGGATPGAEDVPGVLDVQKEKARLADIKQSFGVAGGRALSAPEYSDVEEDVTAAYARSPSPGARDTPGWQPAFLKRASSSSSGSSNPQARKSTQPTPPPGAVPITPSLIRAVERINRAQEQAYGQLPNPFPETNEAPKHNYPPFLAARREHVVLDMNSDAMRSIPGLPMINEEQKQRESGDWDEFWRDIRAKAAEVDPQH